MRIATLGLLLMLMLMLLLLLIKRKIRWEEQGKRVNVSKFVLKFFFTKMKLSQAFPGHQSKLRGEKMFTTYYITYRSYLLIICLFRQRMREKEKIYVNSYLPMSHWVKLRWNTQFSLYFIIIFFFLLSLRMMQMLCSQRKVKMSQCNCSRKPMIVSITSVLVTMNP